MEELREKYYLGYYTKVVNEASSIRENQEEVEYIVLRSRLALDQIDLVENTTKNGENTVKKGINLLAKALKVKTESTLDVVLEKTETNLISSSVYYAICIALIQVRAEKYNEALTILHSLDYPEAVALRIQCLLMINRPDIAQGELDNISNPILKVLCSAYVGLYRGQDETRDALFSLLDLAERYPASPLLANACACCHFAIGEWESGRDKLQSIEEKFPSNPATTINLAVALAHTTDEEKLQNQILLIQNLPDQKYNNQLEAMLQDFDNIAAQIKSS